MKNLLLSTAAVFALTAGTVGSVSAAEVAPRLVYKAAPVVCPTCDWSGFYIGFNLGESKDSSSTTDTWAWFYNYPAGSVVSVSGSATTFIPATTFTTTQSSQYHHGSTGFIGGAQWGYNWQVGSVVVGLEGDWMWSREEDTHTHTAQPVVGLLGGANPLIISAAPNSTQGFTNQEKLDWLSTWRARLGWAHDGYLWYATGGVAWAKVESNYTVFSTPGVNNPPPALGSNWGLPGGVAAANFSTTKTGWVLGGGVETSIGALFGLGTNNWTMKLEYLYVDLGDVNNAIGTTLVPITLSAGLVATGSTAFDSTSHVREQIVRVGVNYKFGYAPLLPW